MRKTLKNTENSAQLSYNPILKLINNSSGLNKENQQRDDGFRNPVLFSIDFGDFILLFSMYLMISLERLERFQHLSVVKPKPK